MDPYEYLLSKLNTTLEFMSDCTSYSLYIKLETGKKLISNNFPLDWTYEHIFKFFRTLDSNEYHRQYHKDLDFFSKFFRNLFLNEYYRQYNKEIDSFCQQLRCFPEDLESTEHVDLLLALNGLQTSDEKSS